MTHKFNITRLTFLIMAFHISNKFSGQISPSTSPPNNFLGTYSSGAQNNSAPNAVLNTVNVSSAASYDIKASNYISFVPGNSIANFSTGSFAAHIDPPAIEVVSYHANGFNNIPRYDKFELGIKLPAIITQKVDNFFGVYKGTNDHPGYGAEFKQKPLYPNNINPYDPNQISVEATFSFPNQPSQTIYGFYYREYTYSTGDPNVTTPTYGATDWVEDLNLQYHWRVRFAPKFVGTYNVTWVVKVNGAIVASDNVGQNFTTTASASLGFIKMGQNSKFMVTQPDASQPEKTILPIGVVEAAPAAAIPIGVDALPASDCNPGGSNDVYYPSRYWRHREKIKTRIAQQGANFVRVFSGEHYGYGFEYEHAGIYDARQNRPIQNNNTNTGAISSSQAQQDGFVATTSKNYGLGGVAFYKGTNRQAIMWEFDKLLDMAKTSTDAGDPLYIQLVVQTMNEGFYAGNVDPNDQASWRYRNPYYNIIYQPNNNSVDQYFTDLNAKIAFKNRLRYIIARYGYSTNIADFEMFNEFHFLHDADKGNIASLDNTFKPWLGEMLDYIKDSINHSDHLFTVSYQQGNTGDNVGSLQKLDFFSTHPYIFAGNSCDYSFVSSQIFKGLYGKPCQAGELGIKPAWDNISYPFPEFMNPVFHTILWSTTFIGGLTSGLANWDQGLSIDPGNVNPQHSCGDGYVPHFKPLQAFVKDIDFDHDNYVPKYYRANIADQQYDQLETFYLIDKNGSLANNAIGYIRNRTFWWTNFTCSNNSYGFYDATLKNQYDIMFAQAPNNDFSLPSSQTVLTGNLGWVKIQGLRANYPYTLELYNTYDDITMQNPISSNIIWSTQYNDYNISPSNFGDCHHQEYAFKIKPTGQMRFANTTLSNIDGEIEEEVFKDAKTTSFYGNMDIVKISPNPSTAIFNIGYSNDLQVKSISIIDNMGKTIKTISGKPAFIDLSNYTNGLYQLQFQTENTIISKKIVLNH